MNKIGEVFCRAEHAARTGDQYTYQLSMAHLTFLACWEAEKAKKAARANVILQALNIILLALMVWFRVWGR